MRTIYPRMYIPAAHFREVRYREMA